MTQLWLVVGFAGQTLFFGRFFVQWLESERQGKSVIPISFWYMSLGGGLLLLAYSIYRRDPVFIAGQLVGGFAYVRNLTLIRRHRDSAGSVRAEGPM
ncbi:MAG: lipid-A-disaccharide synthase N-terminal domain-containing protein [Acidobacteria bacterium]|nr:lipid-A-disaccharide synthase N-terminal domain-containing protein [Acidobacteriota bacterium]